MLYTILVSCVWVIFHVMFRMETVGLENLPAGGYVLTPNHVSGCDPFLIVVCGMSRKKMMILAKEELFKINFIVSWFLKNVGAVSVARGKGDTDMLQRAIESCRNGTPLLVFPEGTRSKTGELQTLKSGAFVIASEANADIVPCRVIYNTPDGLMKPFCRVRICFGSPIAASELALGEPRSAAKLRENKKRLTAALQELQEKYRFS